MAKGEILKTDSMGVILTQLVNEYKPKTILEIGSSDGSGSSTVFADAIRGEDCKLFCIEIMDDRFASLKSVMSRYNNVKCYQVSSVGLSGIVSTQYVYKFREDHRRSFNIWKLYKMQLVMQWYKEVIDQIQLAQIKDGIDFIELDNDLDGFDMVLIDGSPFTAMAELEKVYGAKIIIMDDTMDIKCYDPMMKLINDPNYKLVFRDDKYRNGFAVFKKTDDDKTYIQNGIN